jgi:predicted P-loop ATPase
MKDFITRVKDSYRPPYGASVMQHPRQTILWGTTNHKGFLSDETGNKRYYILELPEGKKADLAFITENRDRIWAAAMDGYTKNISNELTEQARISTDLRNQEYMFYDDWQQVIETYLMGRQQIGGIEILNKALEIPIERISKNEQNRMGKIMRQLGYDLKSKRIGGKFMKLWVSQDVTYLPDSIDKSHISHELSHIDTVTVSTHFSDCDLSISKTYTGEKENNIYNDLF